LRPCVQQTSKTAPSRGRPEETPCRSSRPTVSRASARPAEGAGASDEEANAVAVGCVNANLAGHDSHGIIAIPTYIDRVKAGHIVPGAKWTIVQESPTTTVIDGHWGFGFHVNTKAMELTIAKARPPMSPPAPCSGRAMSAGSPPIR
jgi:LDH2 family malate/lactate/ureidoglycolate dehydrogenase